MCSVSVSVCVSLSDEKLNNSLTDVVSSAFVLRVVQKGAGRGLPVCVIGLRRRCVASSRVRLANFVCFVRLHLLFATAFQSIFTTLAHTPRTHVKRNSHSDTQHSVCRYF